MLQRIKTSMLYWNILCFFGLTRCHWCKIGGMVLKRIFYFFLGWQDAIGARLEAWYWKVYLGTKSMTHIYIAIFIPNPPPSINVTHHVIHIYIFLTWYITKSFSYQIHLPLSKCHSSMSFLNIIFKDVGG